MKKTLLVRSVVTAMGVLMAMTVSSQPRLNTTPVGCILCDDEIQGTGFVFSHPRVVATSFHVVESCNEVQFLASNGNIYDLQMLQNDTVSDASLWYAKMDLCDEPYTKISTQTPELGDTLYYVTQDMTSLRWSGVGLTFDVLQGTSTIHSLGARVNGGGGVGFVEYVGDASPGSSGGPIFNSKGELMALIAQGYDILPVGRDIRARINVGFLFKFKKIETSSRD